MKYIRTILIILLGFLTDYCLYPKPSNHSERLDYVFEQDEIIIDTLSCDCFGCSNDAILITQSDNAISIFDIYSQKKYRRINLMNLEIIYGNA